MITNSGAAIILFALFSCVLFPRLLMQAIVFFSFFSGTAVLNFSNYGMAPAVVLMLAYLFWKAASGDAIRPVGVSRDHFVVVLLIITFAAFSILSLLLNQALHDVLFIQLTQTAYVLFGALITLVLSVDFAQRDRLEDAIVAMRAAAVFIALWGVVQACCYYANIPYPDLFNNSNSHFADMFDQHGEGYIRISSVAIEPSVLAVSLMIFASFGATLLIADARFRTRYWLISVGLALVVVASATSTTGYFGILILIVLLGLRQPRLVFVVCAAATFATGVIVMLLPSFGELIYGVTFGKTSSSSYSDRSSAVLDGLQSFLQQPLLGWGWGGSFSYSIATQLLACTGVVGTICFLAAVSGTFIASRAARRPKSADWRLGAYAQGTENAMIVYLAQSLVTGFHFVVPDFWVLWALAIAIPSCLRCTQGSQAEVEYHHRVGEPAG